MSHCLTTYYTQRLEEEQDQLDAVNDALDALDMDRFQCAVRRINSQPVALCAQKIGKIREIPDALDMLEALAGFLLARVETILPLAADEQRRELDQMNREYEASL